jgi:epoxyqueuosine reductase
LTFLSKKIIVNRGDNMFDKACDILNKYVDDYAFLDAKMYRKERSKIASNDAFSNYAFLDGYQTIIPMVLAYPSQPVKWRGKGNGILSRYSYGLDYHIVFRERIDKIQNAFLELGIQSKGFVDISPIDERFAAQLSTLGFIGKNQFLIHPKYGSFVYLACMIVDAKLAFKQSTMDDCGDCNICIDACPSNALDDGYTRSKCISEISQAKKALNKEEISYFKTMIYGCDICQNVCPKNKGVDFHIHPEFEANGLENIQLLDVIKMSNKSYQNIFKDNASSWKGAGIIKRNALAMLHNHNHPDIDEAVNILSNKYGDVPWFKGTIEEIIKLRKECD